MTIQTYLRRIMANYTNTLTATPRITAASTIQKALSAAQEGCKVRCWNFDDVREALRNAERHIPGLVKDRTEGTTIVLRSGTAGAGWDYGLGVTEVEVEWREEAWRVMSICRAETLEVTPCSVHIVATVDEAQAMLNRGEYLTWFIVD